MLGAPHAAQRAGGRISASIPVIKAADARKRLGRDRRDTRHVQAIELAPCARPASRFLDAPTMELTEAGIPSACRMPVNDMRWARGRSPSRSGEYWNHTAGGSVLATEQSSRTYVHRRPSRVTPRPEQSTGTGVSSAFGAVNWRLAWSGFSKATRPRLCHHCKFSSSAIPRTVQRARVPRCPESKQTTSPDRSNRG